MILSQHNVRLIFSAAQAAILIVRLERLPFGQRVSAGDTSTNSLDALIMRLHFLRITIPPTLICGTRPRCAFSGRALPAHIFTRLLAGACWICGALLAHICGVVWPSTCLATFAQSITRIARFTSILSRFQDAAFRTVCCWWVWAWLPRFLFTIGRKSLCCVSAWPAAHCLSIVIARAAALGARGWYSIHVNLPKRLAAPRMLQASRGFPLLSLYHSLAHQEAINA